MAFLFAPNPLRLAAIPATQRAAKCALLRMATTAADTSSSAAGISAESSCVGCEGIGETLSASEVAAHMAIIPDWKVNEGSTAIKLDFKVRNFKAALDFINRCGEIAEAEGHHPDLAIKSWNHVYVELSTHSLGGLTTNDIILAAKIDTVPVTKK